MQLNLEKLYHLAAFKILLRSINNLSINETSQQLHVFAKNVKMFP